MGVPGLISWLVKNYKNKNIILNNLFLQENLNSNSFNVTNVEYLYLDANCLIHPQAAMVCEKNDNSKIFILENKIIEKVLNYLELIIKKINPSKLIYIAIDGVAPMAKIKQQRLRRFKYMYDKNIYKYYANKHKVLFKAFWNTSSITPGTKFMDKLNNAINNWIDKTNFNCKIIFSSSNIQGEGEHKILQDLKNLKTEDNENIVIYGLDADLLFLSMTSNKNNIYLMRENKNDFNYLSIDVLINIIYEIIINKLDNKLKIKKNLINDFIFLCYLCGNDFIPTIQSLNIKPHNYKLDNGLDIILDEYCKLLNDSELNNYLVSITDGKINLNKNLLIKILENISNLEEEYYLKYYKLSKMYNYNDYQNNYSDYEIDIWNYENNINCQDYINLGNKNLTVEKWKENYYKYYHNINYTDKSYWSLNFLNENYVEGLIWTLHYYFDTCKNYEWFFKYNHAPFISDLLYYLKNNLNIVNYYEKIYNLNNQWFINQITPLDQLVLVLPLESYYLIDDRYQKLIFEKRIKKYFPNYILELQIDNINKLFSWQNIPFISFIEPRIVINLRKKICSDYFYIEDALKIKLK